MRAVYTWHRADLKVGLCRWLVATSEPDGESIVFTAFVILPDWV
jgi:hypothetical protein